MNLTLEILKETNLFSHFSDSEIREFLNKSSVIQKSYNKEEIIFFEGDPCKGVSLIIDGEIHIQQNNALGNTLTISKLHPRNMFGENLVFSNKKTYPVDVVSKSNSIVLHISIDTITSLLMSSKPFLVKFLNDLSNKSLVLSSKLRQLNMKSLRERIIAFLISESKLQKSNVISLNSTKEELAKNFGVQRPSLSRELINMKKDGLISYNRKTITILDIKNLLSD